MSTDHTDCISAQFTSITDERWMTLLDQTPGANIFHHPAWSQLIAECYHFHPQLFGIINSQGDMLAGLPVMKLQKILSGTRWECLPFTDHCFPVYLNSQDRYRLIIELLAAAREKKIKQVGFRGETILHPGIHQSRRYAWHTVLLKEDFSAVAEDIHPMHKRNATTARKRGVSVAWGRSEEDINAFYQLHLQERRRQGIPVQPKRFFLMLKTILFDKNLGSILFAFKDEKIIAALMLLHFNQTLTYKFGASDRNSLAFRPNDLLFWSAIQWGCENHFRVFDLGRSDLDNPGLIRFKAGWGTEEASLDYFTTSQVKRADIGLQIPGLMKTAIRKSPPWVCRILGELFYKYAR